MPAKGRRFIQADTYRLLGHTGTDPNTSRAQGEIDAAWTDEPLARVRQRLLRLGVPAADLDEVERSAVAEMRRVCVDAAASPYPDRWHAYTDVQDVGSPMTEAF